MGVVVLGTGSCLPERVMTNHDLEQTVETSDQWIRTRTGISRRRISSGDEYAHVLAARAAEKALKMAGIGAADLDCIILGTVSAQMSMPSCACFVQREIGAVKAFAYDVNAACSGFLYGLDIAVNTITCKKDQKILVIGVETLSSRVNWQDRNTCVLFGDGAGAAVVGHSDEERGYIDSVLASDGNLWKLLHMHAAPSLNPDLIMPEYPGSHIIMEGKEIFKYAVKNMEDAVRTLLNRQQIDISNVDIVVPHQANIRIINNLMERLAVPAARVFINLAEYGNTSAASIPIALDEANRAGRMQKGDVVLLCSFGGGLTWGASLIRW